MDAVLARRRLLVAGALLVVYVVWGATYLGIALAIETMPPLLMAATRFLTAGLLLYPLAVLVGGRAPRAGRRQWLLAFASGVPLLAVGNGGLVWAQQTVPSGLAALVIATVPLWLALLDRLFFGSRLSPAAVLGLVLGFGGIALLVDLDGTGGVEPFGAALLLLSALGWATGSLVARSAGLPQRLLHAAALQMLCGGAVLAVAGLVAGEASDVELGAVSGRSLAGLAFLVLFGSILAFTCYGWLLRNARTSLVGTYAYVNPVVALLLGWAVLGEEITARTLVASGVIVASVALIVTARAAKAPAGGRALISAVRAR